MTILLCLLWVSFFSMLLLVYPFLAPLSLFKSLLNLIVVIFVLYQLDQSLLWSLLALTSNLGAVISTSLVYYIRSIPKVFSILAKFGMGCTVVFYVFFPQTEHSKLDNAKKTNQSVGQPVARELFCLILSFIAQFLVLYRFISLAES